MKTLFYLMALWPIMYEILSLTDTLKINMIRADLKKKQPEEKYTTMESFVAFGNLFYLIWSFVGLFTFQWPVFLLLIGMGLIPKTSNLTICRIDAFISLMVLIFLIVNSYHLHLTPWL
jgi:hypothetical protein